MNKLISFFKSPVIEFFCSEEDFGVIPPPVSAAKEMPDWFKRSPLAVDSRDHSGARAMGVKKCLPVLDAMSLGFILPLWADVNIRAGNPDYPFLEAGREDVVQYHSVSQLGGPNNSPTGKADAIKFINRWTIKTAPGWSTLFIAPINRIEPRFTCLGGLVDTDKYPKEVNFPAIWHTFPYDGLIEAGTPLVTAIPIKRSAMGRTAPVRQITGKEQRELDRIHRRQMSRRHHYTHELRDAEGRKS